MASVYLRQRETRGIDSAALKQKIRAWGADLAGFGDVSAGLAKEFAHIPRAVSLAVRHPEPAQGIVQAGKVTAYTNRFESIDRRLEQIRKKTVDYFRARGWRALAIPPDTHRPDRRFISRLYPLFSHKIAATCSGLGWVGKSGLLVTPEFGPRLSWATVLTDAPLAVCPKPCQTGQCGACRICLNSCPAGAIKDSNWVLAEDYRPMIDVAACSRQLEVNHQVLGEYLCGQCILSCPLGK